MNEPLNNFAVRQVENGWILSANAPIGCSGLEFVFSSLSDMADWLRVQVVRDISRERNA